MPKKLITIQAQEGSYILTPKEYKTLKDMLKPENGYVSDEELAEKIHNGIFHGTDEIPNITKRVIIDLLKKHR
jgi:hypothetical protein